MAGAVYLYTSKFPETISIQYAERVMAEGNIRDFPIAYRGRTGLQNDAQTRYILDKHCG